MLFDLCPGDLTTLTDAEIKGAISAATLHAHRAPTSTMAAALVAFVGLCERELDRRRRPRIEA